MTVDPDPIPTREPPFRVASWLSLLWPLLVIGILACINAIGVWPAFRQQDTSLLHWMLVRNPQALRGFSRQQNSEETDLLNVLFKRLGDYLTLENIDLSGRDLSSSNLGDMSIDNVNFAGARLVNADFSCTDLSRVNFSGARLINARFDYSECGRHISTTRLHCAKADVEAVSNMLWPYGTPQHISCLQGNFVGADFSGAQIRGARGRRDLFTNGASCDKLLIISGDMTGASFNNATLTCLALINRSKVNRSKVSSSEPFSFDGVSFADARLDRVALLKGSFRFSQFERASLLGLFLNIRPDQVDIDYTKFNELACQLSSLRPPDQSVTQLYSPCLVVPEGPRGSPLHLNFLWSTVVTNLRPSQAGDQFICTPPKNVPAFIQSKLVQSVGFWYVPSTQPSPIRELLICSEDSILSKDSSPPFPLPVSPMEAAGR